jgi:hypothetical protein
VSGVAKSVGKTFKKVVDVGIKVAPFALAAAAVYFTAGAALGVPALAGGWGAASAGLVGSLGAGSGLSAVLTGALTTAGYGAAAGGALGLLTGNPMKTMQMGALGGAVAGGAIGGLGAAAGAGAAAAGPAGAATPAVPGMPTALTVAEGGGIGALGNTAGQVASQAAGGAAAPMAGNAAASSFLGQGGWLERNAGLVGPVVAGLGQGYMAGASSRDEGKALLKRDNAERKYIAGNYGTGAVPGFREAERGTSQRSPTDRFDPATYRGQWVYDRVNQRMVKQ